MTRTGKDTSHTEKTYCILRCFFFHEPKAGMSITGMLNISELLLIHLFWRTFETPDKPETLHGEILLPGSGGGVVGKQESCTIMSSSRNFVLMSSKFALRLPPALVSCLRSLPLASEYTLPISKCFKFTETQSSDCSGMDGKLQYILDTEVLFLGLILGRSFFRRSCRLGQSMTGKQKTK